MAPIISIDGDRRRPRKTTRTPAAAAAAAGMDDENSNEILEATKRYSGIKYATYRMAYKVVSIRRRLRVPNLKIVSSIFAHHCLSISESGFSLEVSELEAVLSDMYFAAAGEGSFDGDIDGAVDLVMNFLLDVYDRERRGSLSVLSAKVALTVIAEDVDDNKWHHLFDTVSDHNGCISPRRLTSLLTQISLIAEHLDEKTAFGTHLVRNEVDKCFVKTPGMLGLSEHGLFQWLNKCSNPGFLSWMEVIGRIQRANRAEPQENRDENEMTQWKCSTCNRKNPPGLKFKCSRCWGMMFCEACYLYNDSRIIVENSPFYKHKRSHIVKEIFDARAVPPKRLVDLMKNFKRMLSCQIRHIDAEAVENTALNSWRKARNDQKMITSTVGKASGCVMADPKYVLKDIIIQLENQNTALKNISILLSDDRQMINSFDRRLKQKVDNHWKQIAMQIERLKLLQDNFQLADYSGDAVNYTPKQHLKLNFNRNNAEMFEMFSPIPALSNERANEPRTSAECKTINVPKMSKGNIDSISHVSMSDISSWIVSDADKIRDGIVNSESMLPEDKFNADLASMAASNDNMKELNADLDNVLDRLQTILANNFALDEVNFDNTQLQETAFEMEGLLGTLIRGVEQRRTHRGDKV